jgi:hypothetical protein
MALEYICSVEIVKGEKIPIPADANYYRAESKKIRFYRVNPAPAINLKLISEGVRSISFNDYERHMCNIYYGDPTFYNESGQVLNENILNP